MAQGVVFSSGGSQFVCLPECVTFPDDVTGVDVVAVGRSRIMAPAGESWDSWFDEKKGSSDFISVRDQCVEQQREGL
jgi:antitoxin VapB